MQRISCRSVAADLTKNRMEDHPNFFKSGARDLQLAEYVFVVLGLRTIEDCRKFRGPYLIYE